VRGVIGGAAALLVLEIRHLLDPRRGERWHRALPATRKSTDRTANHNPVWTLELPLKLCWSFYGIPGKQPAGSGNGRPSPPACIRNGDVRSSKTSPSPQSHADEAAAAGRGFEGRVAIGHHAVRTSERSGVNRDVGMCQGLYLHLQCPREHSQTLQSRQVGEAGGVAAAARAMASTARARGPGRLGHEPARGGISRCRRRRRSAARWPPRPGHPLRPRNSSPTSGRSVSRAAAEARRRSPSRPRAGC
jgi:hypothetical protein